MVMSLLAMFGPIGFAELLVIAIIAVVLLTPLYILLRILRNTNQIARNSRDRDDGK